MAERQRTAPRGSFWRIPLRVRGVFSLEFFSHIWRGMCVLLHLSAHCSGPLPSGKAHSTLLRPVWPCPGWGGGLCTKHFDISSEIVLPIKAAKEEETISISEKTLHVLFGKGACVGPRERSSPHPLIIKA